MSGKLNVTAIVRDGGEAREICVRGQAARALLALVEAGTRGVTALEVCTWALRLAAYCHWLKKRCGLLIAMVREPHPGGWHGRHILRSRVEILSVERGER
jgi:hypothetical protein